MSHYILFKDGSTYEYRFKVLETLIRLHKEGCKSLFLVAELTQSVVRIDHANMTATFTFVGI